MGSAIVILAAGASRRFGSPKQLAPWRGRPLIRFVAEEALATGARVIVVEGAHPVSGALVGLPLDVVSAPQWARGLGASIKAGVARLDDEETVLVTLVDLPYVTRAQLSALLQAPGPLVASSYDGTVGVPAVFRGGFIDALRRLDDAAGAKSVLEANAPHVTVISLPEAGLDCDTPESLRDRDHPLGGGPRD